MGKYTTFANYLAKKESQQFTMTFQEINKYLPKMSPLPKSATKHRAWWANGNKSHAHAQTWLANGYKVLEVQQDKGFVVFEKIQ